MIPLLGGLLLFAAPSSPLTEAEESRLRYLLRAEEFKSVRKPFEASRGYTAAALPMYRRILDDPASDSLTVARTFGVLARMKADRGEFLDRVVARLNDSSATVRYTAVNYLAELGREEDASPVVALLFDGDASVSIAAAKTLAAIGGPRGLTALNVWLAVHQPETAARGRKTLNKFVAEHRDELKAKLEPLRESGATDLAHADQDKRLAAVKALEKNGGDGDGPALVALLANAELPVAVAAGKALSAIGGPRELQALNVWLDVSKTDNYAVEWRGKYQVLKRSVIESRNELRARLDKAAKK